MARRSGNTVVLTHLEFDLLWEDLGSGDPPYPLDVPSHGRTEAERDELGVRVHASLTEAGLFRGDDVDEDLADLFGLLGTAAVSVDATVFRPTQWRVVAAKRGGRGVLAVLNDREIALEPITDLVRAMTRVVGDAPAGPGEQLRLPRAVFSAAMDSFARSGHAGLERVLTEAGVTGRAVRSITTLAGSGRTAAGQLAVSGPAGRTPVLSWTDTDVGRYAMVVEQVSGEPLVRLSPADGGWLTRRLAELLEEAGAPRW
ncbi:ESX secretion-associated protein EspG [Actinosynnema sp. NPDC020468]|uniref:ESX secretion-associated protein EspG n=1 Tax=Actinosynnema sp. NPDC020468 TaxID=3154488 RepID=UPI0033D18DDC